MKPPQRWIKTPTSSNYGQKWGTPFFESYLVTRMRGLVRGSTSPIWVAGTPD